MTDDEPEPPEWARRAAQQMIDTHERSPEVAAVMRKRAPRLERLVLLAQAQRRARQGLALLLPGIGLIVFTSAAWSIALGVMGSTFGTTLLAWALHRRFLATRRPS